MSASCGWLGLDKVVEDKRTEYLKSKALPELEVPPDLTSDTIGDSMAVPGEEDPMTLSEFEQKKAQRSAVAASAKVAADGVEGGDNGAEVPDNGAFEDEQRLTVQGSAFDIWPELRRFWTGKGYQIDLDDAELGIMETEWQNSSEAIRDKFRVFSEPGGDETMLVLFISSEREQQSGGEWIPAPRDMELEKAIVKELNVHFYGATAASLE